MDKYVACAPLNGPSYYADKKSVHQFSVLFTQVHMSNGWFKPIGKFKGCIRDVADLYDPFSGEGNSSRYISVA